MGRRKRRYKVREHQLYTVKSGVWRSLKRENRIDPVYRFRTRRIGIASRIFNPAFLWQTALYSKKIKSISFEGHPPVFILGLWRSGTTHLHYMMARDSQFGYLNNHQAFAFNLSLLSMNRLNAILNIFVPGGRPQDNVRLTLDDPAEEEQPFSTMTRRSSFHSFIFPQNQSYFRKYHLFKDVDREDKSAWAGDYLYLLQNISFYNKKQDLLLKNPHNTGRIKELLELFPKAKFIFLHRDPYTVFQSTKKLWLWTISSQFLQYCSHKEVEDIVINNNALIMNKYLKERKLIPEGNLIEVGFSSFERNPMETAKLIYETLRISDFEKARPPMQAYLDSVKGYQKNVFKELPADIRERIDKEWGRWFEEFGYEKGKR